MVAASFCPLWGQSTKAELFGLLRDASGLAVNAAAVELIHTGTDIGLSVESDANGSFHFFALPAGTYQISVVKRGFATLRRNGVVLRVGDRVRLDLRLEVG